MPTGDAYSSGHLVPSLWDLHMFYLLRPILFPKLSLFYRTMLFDYPSVLSRFCLTHIKVFRSTARQPTQGVGSIRCGSSKIPKNFTIILNLKNFNLNTTNESFDFSTLYTTIPNQKLKSMLTSIIRNSFTYKNGNRRYKYLFLCREGSYYVKEHSDSKSKYTEEDIVRILEFLLDNIFVVFTGKVFNRGRLLPRTFLKTLGTSVFAYYTKVYYKKSICHRGF